MKLDDNNENCCVNIKATLKLIIRYSKCLLIIYTLQGIESASMLANFSQVKLPCPCVAISTFISCAANHHSSPTSGCASIASSDIDSSDLAFVSMNDDSSLFDGDSLFSETYGLMDTDSGFSSNIFSLLEEGSISCRFTFDLDCVLGALFAVFVRSQLSFYAALCHQLKSTFVEITNC